MTHANHTLQDQIKDKTCDRINQGQTANYIRGIDIIILEMTGRT